MSSPVRGYLPYLLIGLSISLIMVGAYAAVGFAASSSPKALWSANPVTITLSGSMGSGSVGEFVKCAPKIDKVVFHTSVSNPTKVSLTVNPTSEATCGPSPHPVTVTAHCLVVALSCKGTYTGSVTILHGYSTVPPSLAATIAVT